MSVPSYGSINWESRFSDWSKDPSKSKEERCQNVINQIRSSINNSDKLKRRDIRIFLQGSYQN